MAKKKVSGIGAIDRAIKSTRTKISAIKKKANQAKAAVRKKRTLDKLKTQLKRMSGSTRTKRR
jgi:hypothetical protein